MQLNMSLSFFGAARETTGARHMFQIDDKSILLDCGMVQGRRKDTYERNKNLRFSARSVHSAILSHAHIDHSGNLPTLVKQGFGGAIYSTPATMDLCKIMLRDSAHIQMKDSEWFGRRNHRKENGVPIEPLYTMEEAETALERFESIHYHRPFHVLHDVEATFYDSGHILGSSAIILNIQRWERKFRLAYSGDIGRADLPILRDPEIPHEVDWLIMESTYGARVHDDINEAKEELRQTIVRVAARGGKIIIPSFSVERTQEVIYYLNELTNEGKLPPVPVFVDSPLAINATEIYRLHPECFDSAVQEMLLQDRDPFGFYRLSYVRDVEESKKLNDLHTPCIIISASGMCEAGRIRHHLRNSIGDSKNCIMFVGYQAEGTLGRKIVERQPEVNILGEVHRVRAEIVTLNAFSGHADKNDLFNYAKTVAEKSPQLKKIFLVHGEMDALTTLGDRLKNELGLSVEIPELGERVFLHGKPVDD